MKILMYETKQVNITSKVVLHFLKDSLNYI